MKSLQKATNIWCKESTRGIPPNPVVIGEMAHFLDADIKHKSEQVEFLLRRFLVLVPDVYQERAELICQQIIETLKQ